MALKEWDDSLRNIPETIVMKALDECRINFEWPPSIAEFIGVCEKFESFPSVDDIIRLAIRRDFQTHPLVELVFNQIGSWSFSNDKEVDLRRKVEAAYKRSVTELRLKRSKGE